MTRRSRNEAVVKMRRAAFELASSDSVECAATVVHFRLTLDRIDSARAQFSPEAGATQAAVLAATLELAQRIDAVRFRAADALERAEFEQCDAANARATSRKALDSALEFERVAAAAEQRKRDARVVPVSGSARP